MIDLSCKYLGLQLKNPIIVGSSGLTSSLENIKTIAGKGAGAVILKSIFEEQIKFDTDHLIHSDDLSMQSWRDAFEEVVGKQEFYFDEAYEYLSNYAKEHTLSHYLKLVSDAKKAVDIPVIASIHCSTQYDWQYFARRIQDAGADALELNAYILPSDFEKNSVDTEMIYFDIINEVKKFISIPLSLKIGFYFSSLAQTALKLSETGIAGLTLFNRPYNPDIDIDIVQINSSNIFSSEAEYSHSLRWVALLAGKLKCNISAATGIHSHETVIKQLLAGADSVQMVSVFYKHNFEVLPTIIKGIETWMKHHKYNSVTDFKGLLSHKNVHNPASYERVQFIRLYSSVV